MDPAKRPVSNFVLYKRQNRRHVRPHTHTRVYCLIVLTNLCYNRMADNFMMVRTRTKKAVHADGVEENSDDEYDEEEEEALVVVKNEDAVKSGAEDKKTEKKE